jgi:hypothetical protein
MSAEFLGYLQGVAIVFFFGVIPLFLLSLLIFRKAPSPPRDESSSQGGPEIP